MELHSLKKKEQIVVVGAVNVDICAKPDAPIVREDSNPGRVSISMGGVGRNIAHNLRLLGQPVSLITVFGNDHNGARVQESLDRLGIDLGGSRTLAGASTSCYVFITDEKGEMQLAVSDMSIYEHITPQFLAERLDAINQSCLCVLDTNLPSESIRFLAEHVTIPMFADPVSTAKMHRLEPVLNRIHTLKPNRLEAELMTGIPICDEASLKKAAAVLLQSGVRRVFITLGANGVLAADQEQMLLLPGIETQVKSTTGGGDCFMAGLAYAFKAGFSIEESARLALAAGAICAEGAQTINEELSMAAVHKRSGICIQEQEA